MNGGLNTYMNTSLLLAPSTLICLCLHCAATSIRRPNLRIQSWKQRKNWALKLRLEHWARQPRPQVTAPVAATPRAETADAELHTSGSYLERAYDLCLSENFQSFTAAETFPQNWNFRRKWKRCSCEWSDLFYLVVCLSFATYGPCCPVTKHSWPATVTHLKDGSH